MLKYCIYQKITKNELFNQVNTNETEINEREIAYINVRKV